MPAQCSCASVLAAKGIPSEASSAVASVFEQELLLSARKQVEHIASDSPSELLFAALKQAMPNLKSMGLDACHICMVYEQAHWHKKTNGSQLLRVIMNKFSKHDSTKELDDWGPFFNGIDVPSETKEETRCIEQMKAGDISKAMAKRIVNKIDPEKPWMARIDFIEAISATIALYADEVKQRTPTGKTLRHHLVNIALPTRIEWLLNDTRFRHTCSRKDLVLMPSGTTSNESLHAEMNSWFHEIQTVYKPQLELKLQIFRLAKLLSHNSALLRPLHKQATQKEVFASYFGIFNNVVTLSMV